ncbi:MAG: hypothetical protein KDK24_11920 [Pseudooceanicola sp.]|nr:hypothetical protein [Pseudooceanicola sp.]
MNIHRSKPDQSHTVALAAALNQLNNPCVGCDNCNGLCADLIDVLVIPDIILSRKRTSP